MKKASRIENIFFSLLIVFLPAQIGKHFWPNNAFIKGIRIDYLSPTLLLTDLLIIGLLVSWALNKNNKRRISDAFKKRNTFVYLLLIVIFVGANTLSATSFPIAIYYWLRFIELAALFLYLKSSRKKTINFLYRYLPITVIYSSIIAISQFLKRSSIEGFFYWLGERRFSITTPGIAKVEIFGRLNLRPYATFPHPNALAGYILIVLILLTGLIFTKRKSFKFVKNILPLTFILGLTTLFLTFSLSAWIATTTLAILLALLRYKRKALPISIVLIVGLISLITVFPPEKQSISQRLSSAKDAITIIQKRPYLGIGLGNFIPSLANINKENSPLLSPFLHYQPVHNIYLLLTAETGLFGLLFFLWFISKTLINTNEKKRLEITLALIGILLIGLVDHYWLTLQQTRLLFTIILALAVS